MIDEQLASQTKSAEAQAAQAAHVVSQAALARGLGAARAHALGRQAQKIWMTRFQEGLVTLALQYGLTAKPSLQDPNFVSTLVFAPDKPAGTPRARLAYLFPGRRRGARLGAHEGRALAGAARPHDRARAQGRGDARVAPGQRGALPGHGRAGHRLGPHEQALARDPAAAARRGARDGGHARAGLQRAPPPAAAGARRARHGAHLRRPGARGGAADDGLDRRAAGARGPVGRLRDPVPGARRREPSPSPAIPRPASPAPRRTARPRSRPRPRPARRRSSCCCSRRCRWCAASRCCSSSASRWRCSARSAPVRRRSR